MRAWRIAVLAWGWLATAGGAAAEPPAGLAACRLNGVEHEAWCGSVERPLDPAQPAGPRIQVHFAVLPALARNRKPDPVFFLAGGPGQSAIALAGAAGRMLGRFSNRRDVVLVDLRGTGRSAPLACDDEDDPRRPLAESADPERQLALLADCRRRLERLPHGRLQFYSTTLAMQDLDAVRERLGAARINLVGVSYGTRAALEYQRLFPQRVRRAVLDGVAPPDMVLPLAFAPDTQAAFDAWLAACEGEAACRARHPALRANWRRLLDSLPRRVTAAHPFTGAEESFELTRDTLAGLVRLPLYVPALAAALPAAVDAAAAGRFAPLLGLGAGLGGSRESAIAQGLHFSVVCAEDVPRMAAAPAPPRTDFGDGFARLYTRACADWPRAAVPEAFYRVPPAPAPVLLLSGGADPVTPPRHAARVAKALGANALSVVVPQAGHGLLGLGCLRDAVFRFVDAETEAQALATDLRCAERVPRPPAFEPVAP
ncbi:MAG: alpha/beta fold hydrolase [Rubrivivax sp.]